MAVPQMAERWIFTRPAPRGPRTRPRPFTHSSRARTPERQRDVRVRPCGRSTGRGRSAPRSPSSASRRIVLQPVVLGVARRAALHVPEHDAPHALESARGPELSEHAVDPVGLLVHVLHEQDRGSSTLRSAHGVPAVAASSDRQPPRSTPSAVPSAQRHAGRPGRSRTARPSPVSACHEARPVVGPVAVGQLPRHHRPVQAGEAQALHLQVQERDVAVAQQRLGVLRAEARGRGAGGAGSCPPPRGRRRWRPPRGPRRGRGAGRDGSPRSPL